MKKTIFIVSLLAGMVAHGQTLPKECTAFLPSVLSKSETVTESDVLKLVNSKDYGQKEKIQNPRHWDVFSDRSNNKLYKDPSTNNPLNKSLKFGQKVRIAKIENGFALVYSEGAGVHYPLISGQAKVRGWVEMSHLLLWKSCPTDENGIHKKALILYNLDDADVKDKGLGSCSQDPDPDNEDVQQEELIPSFDFFYVMKTVEVKGKKRFLLARSHKLEGASDNLLLGWVGENSFIKWNQRSCLEPNWIARDVEYFKKNGIRAQIYADSTLSRKTQHYSFGIVNSGHKKAYQYRMQPNSLRYPILDDPNYRKNRNKYKLTVFGRSSGEISGYAIDYNKNTEKKEEALKQMSQYNIIMVIDGTSSMKKYFEPMAKAIKDVNQYFKKEGNTYQKVRVGAVIYRDYLDGENAIEYQKLVDPRSPEIDDFLTNIGRNGYGAYSSPNDKTNHEALYLGLATALDTLKMGYSARNSNMVFVVGDCGNDPNDKKNTEDELLTLCKGNNVQMFSFQVRYKTGKGQEAFDDFNAQLKKLFKLNARNRYYERAEVKWKPTENGVTLQADDVKNYYASTVLRGQKDEELSGEQLKELVKTSFVSFSDAVKRQIDRIIIPPSKIDEKQAKAQLEIDSIFLVEKMGLENYKRMKELNGVAGYTGYTAAKDNSGRDYWKPVIFISEDELKTLIAKLEPLFRVSNETSPSEQTRNDYVQAVAGIIASMTGQSYDEICSMEAKEISRLIAGGNVQTDATRGNYNGREYTLKEIRDRDACSDEDFQSILKTVYERCEELRTITQKKDFDFILTQNANKYYWLPLDDLP